LAVMDGGFTTDSEIHFSREYPQFNDIARFQLVKHGQRRFVVPWMLQTRGAVVNFGAVRTFRTPLLVELQQTPRAPFFTGCKVPENQ